MRIVAVMALAISAAGGMPCGPSYQRIVDPNGQPLPAETPFVAWIEISPGTGMVFRPVASDIEELIARLDPAEVEDPRMMTAAYWQEMRCRIVNNRCTGECPIRDGKKLRCMADRSPDDPVPPPHKGGGKKKHGKTDGMPKSFLQVSSLRCKCL